MLCGAPKIDLLETATSALFLEYNFDDNITTRALIEKQARTVLERTLYYRTVLFSGVEEGYARGN